MIPRTAADARPPPRMGWLMNAFRPLLPIRSCCVLLLAMWLSSCGAASTRPVPVSQAETALAASSANFTLPPTPASTNTSTPSATRFPVRTNPPTDTALPPTPSSPFSAYMAPLLPEFAVARLGKGALNDAAVSPAGGEIAVAASIGVYLYRMEAE